MQAKEYWDSIYSSKPANQVSWFQACATLSLQLIQQTGVSPEANIIDVGGGASTLVDDLLNSGFTELTVLDLSSSALMLAGTRLGAKAKTVSWLKGDITQIKLPYQQYDVWHDRAVFHFLTDKNSRNAYVKQITHAVKPGGHIIISTFAEDGPTKCNGLPVMRYNPHNLHLEFGNLFTLRAHKKETHYTPLGKIQKFIYCYLTR